MTPQEQLIPHDPDNHIFGDCFRAVLASLLDKDCADVPHFLHDNCDANIFLARVNDYLLKYNLCWMDFPYFDVKKWREESGIIKPIYHEICDISPRFPGTFHSVVGCDGEVIHDPHPSKLGLPDKTDQRSVGFLIHLCG